MHGARSARGSLARGSGKPKAAAGRARGRAWLGVQGPWYRERTPTPLPPSRSCPRPVSRPSLGARPGPPHYLGHRRQSALGLRAAGPGSGQDVDTEAKGLRGGALRGRGGNWEPPSACALGWPWEGRAGGGVSFPAVKTGTRERRGAGCGPARGTCSQRPAAHRSCPELFLPLPPTPLGSISLRSGCYFFAIFRSLILS